MANILWIDDKAGGDTKRKLGFDGLIYFIDKNGHNVEIASTGEKIEAALRKHETYDLIILDIIMDSLPSAKETEHQFGGFDALEILINAQSATPIIILSVMSLHMIRDEADRRNIDLLQSNVKEILRKGPILPSELATIVEIILTKRESQNIGEQV